MTTRAEHRFSNDLRYGEANHPRQWQLTPDYILAPVRADLGGAIELDPCTFADNPTAARRYYTAVEDGLLQNWDAASIFVNPPYGKAREPWVEKCIIAGGFGSKVVLLIPAATDTRIFQRAAATVSVVVFVQGRVKFGDLRKNRRQHAASHPSALMGWNTPLAECRRLGLSMSP